MAEEQKVPSRSMSPENPGNGDIKEPYAGFESAEEFRNYFFEKALEFPQSTQDLISEYSDLFLENDIRQKYRKDDSAIAHVANDFRKTGLPENSVWLTMTYFGLPYPTKK